MSTEQSQTASNIKWGALVAGAAIATGAVLFAPSLLPNIGTALLETGKTISNWIIDIVSNIGSGASSTATSISGEAAKKLAGAALIGGGAAYFMSGSKESTPAPASHEAKESFAMKEDMRKMQALMIARAAAAGHPQLAQGRG